MTTSYTTDVLRNILRDLNVVVISPKYAPNHLSYYWNPFCSPKNINAQTIAGIVE